MGHLHLVVFIVCLPIVSLCLCVLRADVCCLRLLACSVGVALVFRKSHTSGKSPMSSCATTQLSGPPSLFPLPHNPATIATTR